MILAIDPGTTESAWLEYDSYNHSIWACAQQSNEVLIDMLRCGHGQPKESTLVIEMIASYGMPVGAEVFQTVLWIGRFMEAYGGAELIYRQDVKLHLCKSARAKDANIRQALIDRFPATGGGKCPQVGTKSKPGPLFGVKADIWSALAVAVTYSAKKKGAA